MVVNETEASVRQLHTWQEVGCALEREFKWGARRRALRLAFRRVLHPLAGREKARVPGAMPTVRRI
jgi:hypothetical protein